MSNLHLLFVIFLLYICFIQTRSSFNFTAYCNECIVDSNCGCYGGYFILCNGNNNVDQFPKPLNNSTYCTSTNIDVQSFQIQIENYEFKSIPANAFEFTSTQDVSFIIRSNPQLQTIHPQAFVNIKAKLNEFSIEYSSLDQIPTSSILSLSFSNSSCVTLYWNSNAFQDLTPIRQILAHVESNISLLNLQHNRFEKIPYNTFSNSVINLLVLDFNQISLIEKNAFFNLTMDELGLTKNPISEITEEAFQKLTLNILDLDLVGNKSFPREIMRDSKIEYMNIHLFENSPYFDFENWICFQSAPRLCAKAHFFVDHYCADLLKEMDCPDQFSFAVILNARGKDVTNVGVIESPANFTQFFLNSYDNGNSFCFDGSKILTDSFALNLWVCEAALMSISQNARQVSYNGLYNTGYQFIPTVFLKFPNLFSLSFYGTYINCTCGLAKLFYNFIQRVKLTATCIQGGDVSTWMNSSYSNCSDTEETIPEYDSLICQQQCGNFTTVEGNTTVSSKLSAYEQLIISKGGNLFLDSNTFESKVYIPYTF